METRSSAPRVLNMYIRRRGGTFGCWWNIRRAAPWVSRFHGDLREKIFNCNTKSSPALAALWNNTQRRQTDCGPPTNNTRRRYEKLYCDYLSNTRCISMHLWGCFVDEQCGPWNPKNGRIITGVRYIIVRVERAFVYYTTSSQTTVFIIYIMHLFKIWLLFSL